MTKRFIYLFVMLIISKTSVSQIGTTIPINRVVDWTSVGYHNNPSDNLPQYIDSVIVPNPSIDTKTNYSNINKKILEASKKKGLTAVILQNGTYKISKTITLQPNLSNIVIKGSGKTKILFIGNPEKTAYIINIKGKATNWSKSFDITEYNNKLKKIKVNRAVEDLSVGDFIEIKVSNGSWHDSRNHANWNPKDYFGQIVQIVNKNKANNEVTLDNSIQTVWVKSTQESLIPKFAKFTPIQEIGIESIFIETDNNNNRQGFNINFSYAANCWVKNVESSYAASVHLNIVNSALIEVRNSIFHHAKNYGTPAIPENDLVAGTGYGVNIARSSKCLIENNLFYHLRHAMIIQLGADNNVFGYNYSFDQYSFPVKHASDLNIHGHFPYNNLFEGNIIERIQADQWWGSNGNNNTFVRNKTTNGTILIEKTNNASLIGNEAKLIIIESEGIFETYADNKSQVSWNVLSKKNSVLEDISYYHKSRPAFIGNKFSWPPIGPSIKSGVNTKNKIPAQERTKN